MSADRLHDPAEVRIATTGLVRLFALHGQTLRRKAARNFVMTWLGEGVPIPTDFDELNRLMRLPPVELAKRVRLITGAQRAERW